MDESRSKSLSWNDDTIYALGLYRKIARYLGIWPLECNDIGSKIRFLFSIVLQLIMNYNLMNEFLSGCTSIFEAVDFVGLFAANTVGLLKIILIRLNRIKFNRLMDSAVCDWSKNRNPESLEIMRKHASFGRFVSIFQMGTAYISAVPIVLGAPPSFSPNGDSISLTENSTMLLRNLPMGGGCSVVGWSTYLYFSFYIFQMLQLLNMCNCTIGSDALFFGVVMHLCAQIELLKLEMAKLGKSSNEESIKNKLASLIVEHNHLARLSNLIEDVFHAIILGLLAGTSFHMTITGVQMLYGLQGGDHMLFLHSIIVLSILCLQLYLYTYAGDYLATQINELRHSIYACSWYNFPPNLVKDVMFVIMRSNDRFHLTAGKVYRMNIRNFTGILKTMASFFTVIKLMIEK